VRQHTRSINGKKTQRKRTTRDEYDIEQYTPYYGWEVVTGEESITEARERRKEYRENQPEIPVRIRHHRVPL